MSSRRNPPKRTATRKPREAKLRPANLKYAPVRIENQIKVIYWTLAGNRSTAYIDSETGIGGNKYTDLLVYIQWDENLHDWYETVAP